MCSISARLGRLKSIRHGLIALTSLSSVLSAATVDDLTFTLINEGTEYAVTDCADSATGTLTIPETYEGKPVTEIGANAFYESKLTAVELPAGLRSIGANAFDGGALESLSLPAGLTAIGQKAFYNCRSLTGSVTIPSGVTEISPLLFYNSALTEVILHNAVTSIEGYAFVNTKLQSIRLPASLTALGRNAFAYCTSLTGLVTIPSGITEIPDSLFNGCTALTEVVLHDAVTSIGANAFQGTALESLSLPSSLKTIGDSAFYEANLRSISLPSSLRTIGRLAFFNTDLTSISLPAGLTALGESAFSKCTSLTGSVTIPSGVTEISPLLFFSTALTGVVLHDAVTSIGANAFSWTGISAINLPSSLRTIGEFAFYNTDLKSISLPSGLTALGRGVFEYCPSLTGSVTLPSGITELPDYLFANCTALTEVILHDGVTSIGERAFYKTNLQSIRLPKNLISIGSNAFQDTHNLALVWLEGAAPSLGTDALRDAGRNVAGGTTFFIYDSHESSYDNSADWSGYNFAVLPEPNPPLMEAFVLSTSLDASNNRFSIHSHGEPSDASASVLVQKRSSLTQGEWTAVASADVTESRDSTSGVVTRSLSLSPSTEEDGAFYRLHYEGSASGGAE